MGTRARKTSCVDFPPILSCTAFARTFFGRMLSTLLAFLFVFFRMVCLLPLTTSSLICLTESYQRMENTSRPKGYWGNFCFILISLLLYFVLFLSFFISGPKNMRSVLSSLARQEGLDPLVAEHWYKLDGNLFAQKFKVPLPLISPLLSHTRKQEVRTIVKYFDSSFMKAVVSLFPELNLIVTKFGSSPRIILTFTFIITLFFLLI
jgi:hypothetical protein